MEKPSGMGIALGLILCGSVLLAFPKFTSMVTWASWIFYVIGLVVLLVGCLGAMSMRFK